MNHNAASEILRAIEEHSQHVKNPLVKLLFTILTPLLYSIGTILVFAAEHITNSETLKIIQVFLGILLGLLSLIWAAWKNRMVTQEIIEHFKNILKSKKEKK